MTILASVDSKSLASAALDRSAASAATSDPMASVQAAPFHLMNFAMNLKSEFAGSKSGVKRPHSGPSAGDSSATKHPRSGDLSTSPSGASGSGGGKPKIGFSIESIVGSARSESSSAANSPEVPANESGFHSVSPRPSSGTPVSVRSVQSPESIPDHPHSPGSLFRSPGSASADANASNPAAGMMAAAAAAAAGWPHVPPQMNPAYFEALAGMRNLYAQQQQQQQQQQQHMMHPSLMAGHPPGMAMANPMMAGSLPPSAGNHPWWLLAQARQQQQRLLAAAAVQRFPAG